MSVIFHIDLNCFFATVETIINPELVGKPIVVAGNSRRGIITTASYEARAYGIRSGMPLYQAEELCKDLIVVPVRHNVYHRVSQQFFEYIGKYSKLLQVASVDECYVDVTAIVSKYNGPLALAKTIQTELKNNYQLPCSIGIAPNKFLAKMASDMKKPLGITILNENNIEKMLWPLPIADMYGIGKKTQPKLIELGISTIGDLVKEENFYILKSIFGKNTQTVIDHAKGIDRSVVHVDENELKSVGNSTTLEHDTSDEAIIKETIAWLSKKVAQRAQKRNLVSNSIAITIKYTRFQSVVRSVLIKEYINDFDTIYTNALLLFDKYFTGQPLRLLGVSLKNVILKENVVKQLDLFSSQQEDQSIQTIELVHELNRKLGSKKITTASKFKQPDKKIQKKFIE